MNLADQVRNNMARIFGEADVPPVIDISKQTYPTMPNGQQMKPLVEYPAILLKRIKIDDGEWAKKGEQITAHVMPYGKIYLKYDGLVIEDDAVQGKDFKFI